MKDPRTHGHFFGIRSPIIPLILLLGLSIPQVSARAESANHVPAGLAPSPVMIDHQLSGGETSLECTETRVSREFVTEDTGRFLRSVEFFPVIDARRDNTSVRTTAVSLAGQENPTNNANYFDRAGSSEAMVSTDNGNSGGTQGHPEGIADAAVPNHDVQQEISQSRDDFVGHIREYLQTKK